MNWPNLGIFGSVSSYPGCPVFLGETVICFFIAHILKCTRNNDLRLQEIRWKKMHICPYLSSSQAHTNLHTHTYTHTPSLMKNQVLIKSTDTTQVLFRHSNYIIESLIRIQQSLKREQVFTTYFGRKSYELSQVQNFILLITASCFWG